MEKMKIDINLSGQETTKFRNLYLILGISTFIILVLSLVFPEFRIKYYYLIWVVFLPGFIEAILYGLGKKRVFANNLPYLRINEDRIERSKGGLFSKTEIIHWNNIKSIDIKLFELQLETVDSKKSKIELTNLTDDNLKVVKEFVLTIKKSRQL